MLFRDAIPLIATVTLAGSLQAQTIQTTYPVIYSSANTDRASIGKVNADSLWDVATIDVAAQQVLLRTAIDANSFAQAQAFVFSFPRDVELADLNADGFADMIVTNGGTDSRAYLYINNGVGTEVFLSATQFATPPDRIIVSDRCGDTYPEVFIFDASGNAIAAYSDWASGLQAVTINNNYGGPTCEPPANFATPPQVPCGDEPVCSTSPTDPGAQACVEASNCRAAKCKWAACVLYENGDYNWFQWAGAMLACGAVHDAEIVGCIRAVVGN
ncbi:MAG: VCBS repeat-containing protein [Phycisphaerales bacterium]|nr:VCBS repeat-containing protein [Phycisphaerales bacterium]